MSERRMTNYQARIAAIVGTDVDPRHVEAYMRLEWDTLDGLSSASFAREAHSAAAAAKMDPIQAEALAKSYGL